MPVLALAQALDRCATPARAAAWAAAPSGSSPISSRKMVPPSAASNDPARAATAPVNAPRAWPNSSPSISELASAAQSTTTNGPAARDDASWIARATSSLPVPVSPRISTGRVALRDARHLREQLAHRRAGADQAAEARLGPQLDRRRLASGSAARGRCRRRGCARRRAAAPPPTCRFSTKVPLRLPRSRTQVPRSVGSSSACRRDTSRSAMRTWAPGAEPSVVRPADDALVRPRLVVSSPAPAGCARGARAPRDAARSRRRIRRGPSGGSLSKGSPSSYRAVASGVPDAPNRDGVHDAGDLDRRPNAWTSGPPAPQPVDRAVYCCSGPAAGQQQVAVVVHRVLDLAGRCRRASPWRRSPSAVLMAST